MRFIWNRYHITCADIVNIETINIINDMKANDTNSARTQHLREHIFDMLVRNLLTRCWSCYRQQRGCDYVSW